MCAATAILGNNIRNRLVLFTTRRRHKSLRQTAQSVSRHFPHLLVKRGCRHLFGDVHRQQRVVQPSFHLGHIRSAGDRTARGGPRIKDGEVSCSSHAVRCLGIQLSQGCGFVLKLFSKFVAVLAHNVFHPSGNLVLEFEMRFLEKFSFLFPCRYPILLLWVIHKDSHFWQVLCSQAHVYL
jgi:hypothetical protein